MGPIAHELKVLVADDSAVYRKLVENTLSEEDHTVVFAKNGREALDMFAQHQPSLVITDWTMPDITGIELCENIRRDFQHYYAYIILVTSHDDKEQLIEGLAAGADDYLTKPFHPGELLARVRVGRRIVDLHREIQAKNQQLEELALTDPLTGLPNRRAIEIWASRQLNGAARHNFPLWAGVVDLDNFKKINDTYGHEAGDTVLKGFAEILKTNTRSSNICGRLGGEEFLILLTHAQQENALIAFERVRKQLEEKKFVLGNHSYHVTASIGAAGFNGGKPPNLNELIARADSALYEAKHKGRNRIEFAAKEKVA